MFNETTTVCPIDTATNTQLYSIIAVHLLIKQKGKQVMIPSLTF